MSVEPANPIRPVRRKRKDAGGRLREALQALAMGRAEIVRHGEDAWASITFSGARHTLVLMFEGTEAIEAGENVIAELPDHEFAIPGQLVAEATITSVEHVLHPEPQLWVECELLLLVEC